MNEANPAPDVKYLQCLPGPDRIKCFEKRWNLASRIELLLLPPWRQGLIHLLRVCVSITVEFGRVHGLSRSESIDGPIALTAGKDLQFWQRSANPDRRLSGANSRGIAGWRRWRRDWHSVPGIRA